jgi:TP901 family phage tail tape measure protein
MDFSIAIGLQLIDNFSRQLFALKESVSHFNQELNQTQSKLQSFRETLKKAFDPQAIWNASEKLEDFTAKVAQATALPLATLSKTLNAYKSLELAQAEMEVALMTKEGLPTEKIKELNKQVEELGTKLPGTTADFYRVVTALKGAGMELDKIVNGGLKSASYLWVLFREEASPKEVAEMVQNFSNAFRLAQQDFEVFADQLQRLKFASGLTLTQIGYATKYFSAELSQLGFTGLQASKFMLAWIGTLKQFGVAGETAGTGIRSVLQKIPELDKHLEKLRKQGLDININLKDFYDEKGAFKLEEFLMTVRKELSAIQDPLKKMQALRELFDMEGMRAIAPLLAATKDEALMYLEEIKKSIEATHDPKKIAEFREQYEQLKKQIESGGFSGLEKMTKELDNQASLQQRLNRLMNTFANVLEAVEGTLVNLLSVIGSLIAPTLIAILNPLNNLLGKIADFIQENKTVARVLTLAVGGFVSFLAIMGTVSLAFASFMKLFSFAFAPVKWLMSINLVRSLTLAFWQNTIAFVKWMITGQAGTGWLKTLNFWLLKARLALLQYTSALWSNIKALAVWLAQHSKIAFAKLISGFRAVILAVRSFSITLITSPIFWFVLGIIALIGAVYLLWKHWDKVSKALSTVWNWLKSTWEKVSKALLTAWEWLKSSWQKVLEVFINIHPIGILFKALNKLVQYVFGLDLFTAGKKIVENLWKGIESLAMKPVEAMKNIVQKIRNLLPFSPAKEGPLKDIHRIKFIETITASLNPDPLFTRMKDIAIKMSQFALPSSMGLRPALAGPTTITVNIGPIQVSGAEGSKVAQSIASDLEREIRRVLAKIADERNRRSY